MSERFDHKQNELLINSEINKLLSFIVFFIIQSLHVREKMISNSNDNNKN